MKLRGNKEEVYSNLSRWNLILSVAYLSWCDCNACREAAARLSLTYDERLHLWNSEADLARYVSLLRLGQEEIEI